MDRLLCSALILLLCACGTDVERPGPGGGGGGSGDEEPPPPPPDPTAAELFGEYCSRCHGPDGAGAQSGPQILSPVRAYATYVVRNGRGIEMGFPSGMDPIPVGVLPDAQLDSILSWLAAAPKPTTGQGLYTRYCGNCHGADAWGGRVGQDLTHEVGEHFDDDDDDEILEAVREGHARTRYGDRTEYMPSWTAAELSLADVAAITAYIGSLPRNPDDDDDDDDDDLVGRIQ